jgi:threonine/homoserine/homoserine lactone efflux protein
MVYLIQGVLFGLYAAFIPGPFQAFLFSQTLRVGWKRTLPASFVPLISDGPIVMLFLLVLSEAPQGLIHFLRIAGGGFMLYLAWGAYHSSRLEKETAHFPGMLPGQGLSRQY